MVAPSDKLMYIPSPLKLGPLVPRSESTRAYVLATTAEFGITYTTNEMLEAFHKQ
jgi:hypothetical protein